MNLVSKSSMSQAPVLIILVILVSCGGRKADTFVLPPATSPLSQTQIGYGVINVSYTQLKAEPDTGSASPGYLRRGAVVRILEHRVINTGKQIEKWVLAEGNYQGWLREEFVDIYDNELQALTAAEFMSQ